MKHQPIHKHKVELQEVSLESEEEFKKIACPSCHNNVPADNINITDKIAKCNSCDVVFPFEKKIASFISTQKIKQEVIRPEGIEIFRFRDELDISIQQPITVLEIIGLSFSWMFAAPGIGLFSNGKIGIMGLIFALFLALIPYISLFFRSKQRVHIAIDDKSLFLEWRPKKLIRDKRYDINEIDQIYTKTTNNQHHVYMIVNGTKGQKHIPLIKNVGSPSKARYLEQEIEKQIGITDRQVPEENI